MTDRVRSDSELVRYLKQWGHVTAIANVRQCDYAIGFRGQLLPECKSKYDWDHFVKMSYDHDCLLMGTKTADSISKGWRDTGSTVLPGRNTIIASRNGLVNKPADLDISKSSLLVCGGAEIYEQCLPYCHNVSLTVTMTDPAYNSFADSFFPEQTLLRHFKICQTKTQDNVSILTYDRHTGL